MAQISHSNVLDKPYSALSFPSRYLSLTDIQMRTHILFDKKPIF